jgi:tellurite resistance protein TehA-like permease
MADLDKDKDLWEVRSRALNYLLVAHAAGLIACLTVLKDYNTTPQLNGVGWFIWLFGLGLISAVIAVLFLTRSRQAELIPDSNFPPNKWDRKAVGYGSLVSAVLLLAAIGVAICKFGHL